MKTTNAKSKAFQTPAPLSSAKTQKISPRLRRPKVKVHQPQVDAESEDDVPEIEHMPPKEVPLPDDMDDYLPKDWTIPKFSHKDMIRDIWESYHNPIEDDGRTRNQRKFEDDLQREKKKAYEDFDKLFAAQMAEHDAETRRYLGIDEPKSATTTTTAPKRSTTAVSTLKARSAAAALAPSTKPSYAAPTTTTKSRAPAPTKKPLADRSASRNATAAAASKSTIGYAQGRPAQTAARKPLSNIAKPPSRSTAVPQPRPRSALVRSASPVAYLPAKGPYRSVEEEQRDQELLALRVEDDEEEEMWARSFGKMVGQGVHEEEEEEFQFEIPAGL